MSMIFTGTTISFQHNKKFHQANSSHPEFKRIVDLCKQKKFKEASELLDIKAVVQTALGSSAAQLVGSNVVYKGQVVNSLLARRILELHRQGFSVEPLLRFLDNLMENPSKRAVDELYGFLEASKLPITDDGYFLAYKSVRQDFKDHHTGTMDNSVGTVVKMDRNKVDEDKDRTCSHGLHFAAHEYASNFGQSGRMVVLKINPRDVVAIPSDYNNQKGRACEYLVLEEVTRDDKKLVGKAFVPTVAPKTPSAKAQAKPKVTLLPVGSAVTISAVGMQAYRDMVNNPHGVVGKLISNKNGPLFVYEVQWPSGRTNAYQREEIELVKPKTTGYTPQADNYGNGKLWASNASRRVFKGTAEEFPVNRDVVYSLTRKSDEKEYSGEFYFIEYKKGNLVFVRYDRAGKPERYVTVADVSNWKITTPTKRV